MDSYLRDKIRKLKEEPSVENARALRIYINTFFAPFDPQIKPAQQAIREFWNEVSTV